MPRRGPTPDFDQVTLKWAGVNLDGTPCTGRLELAYNRPAPMLDEDADFPVAIYPTLLAKPLVTAVIQVQGDTDGVLEDRTVGYAAWRVPATDDADILGAGGTYTLTERLDNGRGVVRTFVASKDVPGGVMWLNRITSVIPVAGEAVSAVSVLAFSTLSDRVGDLEVNGPGGALTWAELAGKPATFPPSIGTTAATAVAGNDLRLTNARAPLTHTSASVSDFVEAAQDAVALMLAAGTNVTLLYNDASNSLSITAAGGTGTDPEAVRDAIGVALLGAGVVSVVANDAGDTITISSTATQNSTDAALRDRGTHTGLQLASTISDFSESAQDVVGAMVAAAGGTYNDAAGTLTLPAGGAGGDPTVLPTAVVTASRGVLAADMGRLLVGADDSNPVVFYLPLTAAVPPTFGETFAGVADNQPWPTARWTNDNGIYQIVLGGRGRMISPAGAYASMNPVVSQMTPQVDYDFYIDVLDPDPAALKYFKIAWRAPADGATAAGAPYAGYFMEWKSVAGSFDVCRMVAGNKTVLVENVPFAYTSAGARFRIYHVGDDVKVKAYAANVAEPPGWTADLLDPAPYLTAGVMSLLLASGDVATSRILDIDNIRLAGANGPVVAIPSTSVFSAAGQGAAGTWVAITPGVALWVNGQSATSVSIPIHTEKSFRLHGPNEWWGQ